MANPHLTPTVIVNKNGVTTTVHKKSAVAPSTAASIPSPAIAPVTRLSNESRKELELDILLLTEKYCPIQTREQSQLLRKLSAFSDSTIQLVIAAAEKQRINPIIILNRTEAVVRENAFYYHRFTSRIDPFNASEMIAGLHFLERYQSTNHMDSLTGTELEIATAYLNVTTAIHEHGNHKGLNDVAEYQDKAVSYIEDRRLQDFVAAHYQDAEAIVTYIRERGDTDTGAMLVYLEDSSPLKDGTL